MEQLLSLSFDNISSRDVHKVRKGLRQIEGLLAQICLSRDRSNNNSNKQKRQPDGSSSLSKIAVDPAFREFFKLQERFEGNVASRLISCLERLLSIPSHENPDAVILAALDLLQGILLLHPPSRTLFRQEIHMTVLLDLLDPSLNPAPLQSQALLTLVTSLLQNPANTRTFENLDGLLTVASLFKSQKAAKEVKMKAVEFFYFYLMPETPQASGPADKRRSTSGAVGSTTRSTEEKQEMLGRYMSNVAELVQDLEEAAPFEVAA